MGKKATKKLMIKAKKKWGEQKDSVKEKVQRTNRSPNLSKKKLSKQKVSLKSPKLNTMIRRQHEDLKKRAHKKLKTDNDSKVNTTQLHEKAFDVNSGLSSQYLKKEIKSENDCTVSFEDFVEDVSSANNLLSFTKSANETNNSNQKNMNHNEKNISGDDMEGIEKIDSESDDEIEHHKQQLKDLQRNDPTFFKHLLQEDKELLEFGEEKYDYNFINDLNDKENQKTIIVNTQFFNKLKKLAFEEQDMKALILVVHLFDLSSKLSDSVEKNDDADIDDFYNIVDDNVKSHIVHSVVHNLWQYLDLKTKVNRSASHASLTKPKKLRDWTKYQVIFKRFMTSLLKLLKQTKDHKTQIYLLRQTRPYTIYLASCSTKIFRIWMQFFILTWGDPASERSLRIISFSCIQQAAIENKPLLSSIIKSSYLEFVRGCKTHSVQQQERISFQAKCLVDLLGINLSNSYELAFIYIRQLALHLRAATISKTNESLENIYSWQFVHCLRLWGIVLSTYSGKPEADDKSNKLNAHQCQLRSLTYPFIQILIGTIKLSNSLRYIPIHLHIFAIINTVARSSSYFVHISHLFLDKLQNKFFESPIPNTSSSTTRLSLENTIKISKQGLSSQIIQTLIFERILELLETHLDIYRFSIAFPELAFPIVVFLRQFSKKSVVSEWRKLTRSLATTLKEWINQVKQERIKVDFTPSNIPKLHQFMSREEEHYRAIQNKRYAKDFFNESNEIFIDSDKENDNHIKNSSKNQIEDHLKIYDEKNEMCKQIDKKIIDSGADMIERMEFSDSD